jgi:hypothetical protein
VGAVTVLQAARSLGVSRATVQRDIRLGCAGIVRLGEPGRGKGALLDLTEYRRWRAGERDDGRILKIAAETALRTWQTHGGLTATLRRQSARVLALQLVAFSRSLTGTDPEQSEELLALFNVSVSSAQSTRKVTDERF